jgi:hypothetical protein
MSKPWYQSITTWLQIISFTIAIISLVIDQAGLFDLDSRAVSILMAVVAILTQARRLLVGQHAPIEGTPAAESARLDATRADLLDRASRETGAIRLRRKQGAEQADRLARERADPGGHSP